MQTSQALFEAAQKIIPGGVNSPVRAFKAVGGIPPFFKAAKGCTLIDEDDREYIDYVGSWGPMILGHQDPDVVRAVQQAVEKAMSFGAPTKVELLLAKHICEVVPNIEMIRMVNSGTEATMTALRLARGYTGRDLIVKFEGCYHGHSDSLLIKAGSGALTHGQPSSPGIPADFAKHTLNCQYNDSAEIKTVFESLGDKIAAVIIEPVAGNMGCIPAKADFLSTIRSLCTKHGSLLIFDEVITGFRVAQGGAQAYYGVSADIITLGKIIGGGMPVGAIGGKAAIMSHLSPLGGVYQAGTLSGNPVAMAAGLATLNKIAKNPNFYEDIRQKTEMLVNGFKDIAQHLNIPLQINWAPGFFSFFFCEHPVKTYADAMKSDTAKFNQFYQGMLAAGFYFGPSAFESAMVSITHTKPIIEKTLVTAEKVMKML